MKLSSVSFPYGLNKKRLNALFIFLGGFSLLFFALLSFFYYDQVIKGTFIDFFLNHVRFNIYEHFSILGMFYVAFFGGLFFLTIPIELFYINALKGNPAIFVFLVSLAGIAISYSLDYYLGFRFANFSKKLISVKQFYKIKLIVNRWGSLAIIFFNLVGFGSQALTFIMGVFRYNKARIFAMTALGEIIKFAFLAFLFGKF